MKNQAVNDPQILVKDGYSPYTEPADFFEG